MCVCVRCVWCVCGLVCGMCVCVRCVWCVCGCVVCAYVVCVQGFVDSIYISFIVWWAISWFASTKALP